MLHDELLSDLRASATLSLLASPHAPLILAFLSKEFKEAQRVTVAHSELSERLEDFLEALALSHPGRYPGSAQSYLRSWTDDNHRFLRRYYEADRDDPLYELTPDSERALRWVQELRKSEFVGTESRFLRVFDLLEELVTYGSEDAETRLRRLEGEQARLQREIEEIRATGRAQPYSQTQIRERFAEANEVAMRLLADFREVEENFRLIARQVQEKQLELGSHKGAIVGHVLDADAALKESDQGRSFYAFWEFLMSPTRQEQLRQLLDGALTLSPLQADAVGASRLRHLKGNLLEAGKQVISSNRRLGEQLRRLLDEQNLAEQRRVLELAVEIKQLALRLTPMLAGQPDFWPMEAFQPDVQLPMERQWWAPSDALALAQVQLEAPTEGPTLEVLASLYSHFFVDSARLQRRLDQLLEQRPTATLSEVVAAFPVEQGLSELLGYLAIAAREPHHSIAAAAQQQLSLTIEGQAHLLRLPTITFRRAPPA